MVTKVGIFFFKSQSRSKHWKLAFLEALFLSPRDHCQGKNGVSPPCLEFSDNKPVLFRDKLLKRNMVKRFLSVKTLLNFENQFQVEWVIWPFHAVSDPLVQKGGHICVLTDMKGACFRDVRIYFRLHLRPLRQSESWLKSEVRSALSPGIYSLQSQATLWL